MGNEGGSGLPASIEAAWGLRGRPAKGPKPGLTLERIVEAGVRIAGAEGLQAVSMSRVAAELGAGTMALYRYVEAKDELLALMVDAAIGRPPAAPEPDAGWRAGLANWAWAELEVLRRHLWALRVPITGPPATPNQVAWLEEGLRCMNDTNLEAAERLSVILLISGFVRNDATLAADVEAGFAAAAATPQEAMSAYGGLLKKLTDPQRFPALTAILDAGVLDRADDPDDEFIFGLERILDGIAVLVRARSGGSGAGVHPEP